MIQVMTIGIYPGRGCLPSPPPCLAVVRLASWWHGWFLSLSRLLIGGKEGNAFHMVKKQPGLKVNLKGIFRITKQISWTEAEGCITYFWSWICLDSFPSFTFCYIFKTFPFTTAPPAPSHPAVISLFLK